MIILNMFATSTLRDAFKMISTPLRRIDLSRIHNKTYYHSEKIYTDRSDPDRSQRQLKSLLLTKEKGTRKSKSITETS